MTMLLMFTASSASLVSSSHPHAPRTNLQRAFKTALHSTEFQINKITLVWKSFDGSEVVRIHFDIWHGLRQSVPEKNVSLHLYFQYKPAMTAFLLCFFWGFSFCHVVYYVMHRWHTHGIWFFLIIIIKLTAKLFVNFTFYFASSVYYSEVISEE